MRWIAGTDKRRSNIQLLLFLFNSHSVQINVYAPVETSAQSDLFGALLLRLEILPSGILVGTEQIQHSKERQTFLIIKDDAPLQRPVNRTIQVCNGFPIFGDTSFTEYVELLEL